MESRLRKICTSAGRASPGGFSLPSATWRLHKAFEINPRSNFIRYEAGENWDADRLMKELPETLCARRSRDSVIMDLDAARDFFGIDFKRRSIFGRFIGG